MKLSKLLPVIIITMLLAVGCSNDDKGNGPDTPENTVTTTWDGVGQFWVTTLDATSEDDYTYYSFADRDVVEMTEAEAMASTEWDIAFKRYHAVTNGGVYGMGDVMATNLVLAGITDTLGFEMVEMSDVASVGASDWLETDYNRVVDDYFEFNTQTFQLDMTDVVYALRDASGNFMKLQFTNISGGGVPPTMGDIALRYVYQPIAASADLSGPIETDTIFTTADTVFYDFSAGTYTLGTRPADPMGWDIALHHYDVMLNSSINGPGQAAANPIDVVSLGTLGATDFDGYTQAETTPQAYSMDFITSALELALVGSADADLNWYAYENMKILSQKYSYIVGSGGDYYKLYMVSYYHPDSGASGHISFNWVKL